MPLPIQGRPHLGSQACLLLLHCSLQHIHLGPQPLHLSTTLLLLTDQLAALLGVAGAEGRGSHAAGSHTVTSPHTQSDFPPPPLPPGIKLWMPLDIRTYTDIPDLEFTQFHSVCVGQTVQLPDRGGERRGGEKGGEEEDRREEGRSGKKRCSGKWEREVIGRVGGGRGEERKGERDTSSLLRQQRSSCLLVSPGPPVPGCHSLLSLLHLTSHPLQLLLH